MSASFGSRGASEAIGFVIVFSLIVSTVGVVYAVGYAGLIDARDAERVNNAERAFDVLADNIEDITERGAPSRATELKLADASIGAGEETYINVSASDGTHEDYSTGEIRLGAIAYEADDTTIRFSGGAIVRADGDAAIVLREPNFVLQQEHVLMTLVQLDTGDSEIAGTRTVQIRAEREYREVLVSEDRTYDEVRVNVTSPHLDAWERYLENDGMDCSIVDPAGDDKRVTCTLSDVERVRILYVRIGVTID